MRIPRFYLDLPLHVSQHLELPAEAFRHAVQVLRLAAGEAIILFNGKGGEYWARLEQVSKRGATAHIQRFDPSERESPLALTLAQAVIKPDKMDLILQKAVELGVTAVQPLVTERSVVRLGQERADKKMQHWQGILRAACEQCGRTRLPWLHEPLPLPDWLAQNPPGTRLILSLGDHPRLANLPATLAPPLTLLVGPEGGFTAAEVALCLQQDAVPVSLGSRTLRAETAALVGLAALQQRYGDL